MINGTLEIDVTKIEVDGRWYTINYIAFYKNKTYHCEINEDHVWDEKEWLEDLKDGEALTMAFSDFVEHHLV